MKKNEVFYVVIFYSVHHAMRSEKILREMGIPHKLIPVPRHISSDCGVCIQFPADLRQKVEEALIGKVEIHEIRPL